MTLFQYVIEARGLTKAYGKTQVLKGIDLQVERGTMVALLGPNGAGKTTTVRILSTLLGFDGGTAFVDGHNVTTEADKVRAVIGLTGQATAGDELLTVRENLVMMGPLYRLTAASARQRAQELLEEFDLVEAAGRPAKTYSGGMRRRLDLAVSLIATPPVLFLDEPTTGLDPRSRLAMWEIIKSLVAQGITILLTTQYLEEADQLADQIVVIDGGKVIAEGTAPELKAKVGRDRLELTFSDATTQAKALKVLNGGAAVKSTGEVTASMEISDVGTDVTRTLDCLHQARLKVTELAVHKPTLDDVFLTLTGKTKTDTKQEDQ